MAKAHTSRSKSRAKQNHRAKLKPQDCTLGLQVVNPKAAGIDVGNDEHWVAVPPDLDPEPVRRFGCFTSDLLEMADWLVRCGIETAVMQSTGVYGTALHDILAERGIRVFVVNARDTKNLPGRKTDIQECQWLLKLHVYGLLRNSFRPEEEILMMRTYWRQRQQHIGDASRCIQHMQKALTQMNVQLANAISDISGTTGQAILSAILAGERDPQTLAKLRDPRCKASEATVAQSLEGNWRPELLFVLKQEVESYRAFQTKIAECDQQLHQHYETMEAKADPKQLPPVPRDKRPHGNIPAGIPSQGSAAHMATVRQHERWEAGNPFWRGAKVVVRSCTQSVRRCSAMGGGFTGVEWRTGFRGLHGWLPAIQRGKRQAETD